MHRMLRAKRCRSSALSAPGAAGVAAGAASAAAAAAHKHEGNKCRLVDAGLGGGLVAVLRGPCAEDARAVVAVCAALRLMATADDARPTTSRCGACPELCRQGLTLGSPRLQEQPLTAHGCIGAHPPRRQRVAPRELLRACACAIVCRKHQHASLKELWLALCVGATVYLQLSMRRTPPRTVIELDEQGPARGRRCGLSARARAPRAFQNGRTLAQAGAPLALLAVLRPAGAAPEVVAAACGAVKRLAVNEDICMEFADAGGVKACLEVCASLLAGQRAGSPHAWSAPLRAPPAVQIRSAASLVGGSVWRR